MKYSRIFLLFIFLFMVPAGASAHQPYLVDGEKQITVISPDVSKVYYGELKNVPTVYYVREEKPFALYVNILVPASEGIPRDLTAEIRQNNETITFLEASSTDWARMYEPYGGDDYYQGPEWKLENATGTFDIIVSRPGNSGKYVLAIGEKEEFNFDEILRTMGELPGVKVFMGKPAWTAYFNRVGIFMLGSLIALWIAFLFIGEIIRMIGNLFQKMFGKPKHFHD